MKSEGVNIGSCRSGELPGSGAVLTLAEFAKIMRVSYGAVARKVRLGEIPAHRIGGAKRIIFGEYLEASKIAPPWKRGRPGR